MIREWVIWQKSLTIAATTVKGVLRSFAPPEVERSFLTQYRQSGLRFARFAFLLGAVLALVFFVLVLSIKDDEGPTNPRQLLRLTLAVVLMAAATFLTVWRNQAVEHYVAIVGGCVVFASLAIGGMSLLPSDVGDTRSGRWTVAMCLTCWLAYGFCRLPAPIVAFACGLGSIAILVSANIYGDDYVRALGVYLLMANVIGWIMSVEIERRERALFWSSRQLRETTQRLQEMARKASEADAAKTRVLAAVSHDLRQPLASLTLYSQLLREKGARTRGDDFDRSVEGIDACIGALSSDLDRLSELGLRERGIPLPVEAVDLRSVIQRIERVYSGQAVRFDVRLVVRVPQARRYVVMSNESRLWDVFANLVGNALKFSAAERGAWVLVRIRRCGDGVEVVVRDNGIGIGGGDQARVFDEYFQVSNPARSAKQGHGLGLSIVRETLSRLPGHSIRLVSAPRRGALFAVHLPAARNVPERECGGLDSRDGISIEYRCVDPTLGDASAGASEPHAANYGVSAPVGEASSADSDIDPTPGFIDEACVLIIEDDESMRDALERIFERWGLNVESVADGEQAVHTLLNSQRSFDAIVSDYRLPGAWDGLRLIEELRRLEGRRTPAILLSGEFRVEALRSEAPRDVQVMGKPPDINRLRELLPLHQSNSATERS